MGEKEINHVLDCIDSYEQAVHASLSFMHLYKYDEKLKCNDPKIKHWLGKEFNPGNLTPDISIQLSNEKGIVVELKESLPQNNAGKDYWKEKFKKLKRYDQSLEGWSTDSGKVNEQNLVLMTDKKLVRKVITYIKDNNLNFNEFSKNFCVIEYGPANGRKEAIFLRLEEGKIDDFKTITNKRLYEGIAVSREFLIYSGLSKIFFVDYKPHPVYLMSILWDKIFSSMISDERWRSAKMESGRKIIELESSVKKIRDMVANYFSDPEAKHCIKEGWIKEALENFVRLKLAKRKKEKGEYIIKYKKQIKDEREDTNKHRVFAELLYKSGIQITLDEFEKSKK